MKIEYTLELEDIVLYNLKYIRSLPESLKSIKRNRWILPLIYGSIGVAILGVTPEHWLMGGFLVLLSGLWFKFYPSVWDQKTARQLKRHFKKRDDLNLKTLNTINFKGDCFEVKSSSREGKIHWNQVIKAESDNLYIYLYLTEEDAIIIPKSRIDDKSKWEALVALVSEKTQ